MNRKKKPQPFHLERRIKLLQDLVRINSGTANIAGVDKVQSLVQSELTHLGFSTRLIKNSLGASMSGRMLVGELLGATRQFITFVTHADTVFELDSAFQKFKILAGGEQAQGPGVIDDKGGIVVALAGIHEFLAEGGTRPSLRFICAPSEETGSEGFLKDFARFSKDSMLVLGFEPALDNGSIVHGRWGNRWYQIKVSGKEAHAGRAHEMGANAGHELVIKLDRLQKLTDYRKPATVNIGSIQAGSGKYNIVCGHAEGRIDARFPDEKTREFLHRKITSILRRTHVCSHLGKVPTRTTYSLSNDCPPIEASSQALPFIRCYQQSIRRLEGKKILAEVSRGAADINGMRRKDLIALDGLGAWGGRMHSEDEFIRLNSLVTRATALEELLVMAGMKFG